jgi:hypothetical protein
MYFSEIEIGNNCILGRADGTITSYIRHYTYNTMFTNNPVFCGETDAWIQNLIRKSVLISGVSEKYRFIYFRMIRQRIEELKARAEKS